MAPIWYSLLSFCTALATVLWSTPQVRKLALQHGYVDRPSARKVHAYPIARLGGIAICFSTCLTLMLVALLGGTHQIPIDISLKLAWLLLGSLGFFLLGVVDDLLTLSAIARLAVQLGISSLMWVVGIQITFLSFPGIGIVHLGWLSLPITILWLAGVVNAINWIDGLDGLASGVSGIAAIVIFLVSLFMGQPGAALIMAALGGSLVGFLYYNFNPAQIFMGDGGSYFIGFLIAGTSILGLAKSATAITLFLPLLILAVPLLDMSAVILSRLSSGRSPFTADKRHLHHRLINAGLSHRSTVLTIYSLALWVGSLAIVLAGIPNGVLLFYSATGLLLFTTWKVLQSARPF